MKILYGVQATGQGHISRARAMSAALCAYPVQVDWLFSGRSRERLFDMEPFGDFTHRRGLTFNTGGGRIRYLDTVTGNNVPQFLRDVADLDLSSYDIVVTDFEPVTAWAARRRGVRSVGIGHQYAFGPRTPTSGGNALTRFIMRQFAPVDVPIGLHWYPYADNVLPPILDLPRLEVRSGDHVLVYLPFEDQAEVTRMLRGFPEQRFVQYANGLEQATRDNVTLHPASTVTFKRHLATSNGVICNSGFELISECLQWRKPVLTKPLAGQLEQLSNALALEQLGYARAMHTLDPWSIGSWLAHHRETPACRFRDAATALARWLAQGCRETPGELAAELWPGMGGTLPPRGVGLPGAALAG